MVGGAVQLESAVAVFNDSVFEGNQCTQGSSVEEEGLGRRVEACNVMRSLREASHPSLNHVCVVTPECCCFLLWSPVSNANRENHPCPSDKWHRNEAQGYGSTCGIRADSVAPPARPDFQRRCLLREQLEPHPVRVQLYRKHGHVGGRGHLYYEWEIRSVMAFVDSTRGGRGGRGEGRGRYGSYKSDRPPPHEFSAISFCVAHPGNVGIH